MPIHDELGHGKRLHVFLLNRSDSAGQPRADLWRQGLADFVQLDVDASVLWTSIGPGPLNIDSQVMWSNAPNPPIPDKSFQGAGPDSGEVTDIAIDPSGAADTNICIATNDGGIWRSTDGGTTWLPTMDPMLSLSMGAVAIDPANPQIVYAGSGNFYDGGSEFTKGVGIYRSSDGGSTWSIVDGGPFATVFAGFSINGIVVPAPDTLLVATDQGLYRSIDGGQNFGANSPAFDNRQPLIAGFITCLLLDATNPSTTFYAGVSGIGVMTSTDLGVNLTNLFNNPGAPTSQPFGNLEIAQSESNPQTLVVSVQYSPPNATPVFRGLFQSVDGGQHWSPLSTIPPAASDGFGQTNYDLTLGIDPQNPQLVYAGFQELWKSSDGGSTFQSPACTTGQVHWDNHALVFSPKGHRAAAPPATVYTGTDGGISKSVDGGANWIPINGAIASNLFFGIDIGKGAGNAYTYGGCQDTGTSAHRPADAGTTVWHLGIDGDGYYVAVDPTDPMIVYGFDDALFIKSTDAGVTWQTSSSAQVGSVPIGNNLPVLSFPTRAVALEQNGTNTASRVVYVAYNQNLYKSSDAGLNFGASIKNTPTNIVAVTTTTADSNRIWIGTAAQFSGSQMVANGSVHVSADAGATWDQGSFVTQPGVGSVTGIAVDPTNVSRVAIVYAGQSGINSKYRTQRVFLTTDNGATWNDVSGTDGNGPLGNLPDLPMHSVVFDKSVTPPAIVVASDAGVMRCTDATVSGSTVTATWKIYGAGMPNVSCSSLAIDNSVTPPVLRVGTYGRGCFEVTHPTGPVVSVESSLGFGTVPVGKSGTLSIYLYNCGDAPLTVTGITRLAGSADFAVSPTAAIPATVAPGGTQAFDVVFTPSSVGDQTAGFDIASNDLSSPYVVLASGRGVAALAPRLATNPGSATGFGTVQGKSNRTVLLQMFNTGTSDLGVTALNLTGNSDFTVDPAVTLPIAIAPGGESDVTLKYQPTGNGNVQAALQIVSNDSAGARVIRLNGSGVAASGSLWPIIAVLIGVAVIAGGAVAYEELK
jgi:hypothetical protein